MPNRHLKDGTRRSMPVRIAIGGQASDPYDEIGSRRDPARVVTSGPSDPIRTHRDPNTPHLPPVTDIPVIIAAVGDSQTVIITFSKEMKDLLTTNDFKLGWSVGVNGGFYGIALASLLSPSAYIFTLTVPLVLHDVVTLNYTVGNSVSIEEVPLEAFQDYPVTLQLSPP